MRGQITGIWPRFSFPSKVSPLANQPKTLDSVAFWQICFYITGCRSAVPERLEIGRKDFQGLTSELRTIKWLIKHLRLAPFPRQSLR